MNFFNFFLFFFFFFFFFFFCFFFFFFFVFVFFVFLFLDVERMKELMNHMVVFDGRNVYAKSRSLHEACKYYWGVGI